MTNISAPYTESPSLRNAYRNLGLLDTAFVFKIPTYRNMPPIQHLVDFDQMDSYSHKRGDVNQDHALTLTDYTLLLVDVSENHIQPDAVEQILRDVNDDGVIDAFDVADLNRLLEG